MDAKIEKNSMDVIVAVSAIEHCGCGSYGDKKGLTTDKEVVQRMKQILKPNGKLIITIPFGIGANKLYYIYNEKTLKELLEGFSIEKEEYYKGVKCEAWTPTEPSELMKIDSSKYVQGVACIVAKKNTK